MIAGVRSYTPTSSAYPGTPITIVVGCDGKTYRAHRIIWEMHNGPIPDEMVIDHINGDPFDNRLSNLRICTTAQNRMNNGPSRASKTGYKGVVYNPNRRLYEAGISINGKRKNLGRYKTPQEAHTAYINAASKQYGEYLRK